MPESFKKKAERDEKNAKSVAEMKKKAKEERVSSRKTMAERAEKYYIARRDAERAIIDEKRKVGVWI